MGQIIPYKGIRVLANRAEFFMGTQETIIYRLVLTNSGFVPDLPFSIFWALQKSVASKPEQKVDPLDGPFGSPAFSE